MQEEFHWEEGKGYQQLYGWSSLHASVWLPSLIELVGFDPNSYNDTRGCYLSAMQGLNISSLYYVDTQGGTQFTYFQQYNTTGGGQKIWDACNRQWCWLRSPDNGQNHSVMTYSSVHGISSNRLATASCAVHPAV